MLHLVCSYWLGPWSRQNENPMQVETDGVWRIDGRHRVSVELSTRITHELKEVTTQGRRRPASLYAWFEVSAQKSKLSGFGKAVPLIRELDPPRTHRAWTSSLDFRVALTTEAAEALLGRPGPVAQGVALRFRFRGVYRARRSDKSNIGGADVWGPMGLFSPPPPEPKWIMEAPSEPIHTDIVEGLTFELEGSHPKPRLAIQVVSVPDHPRDPLELRWTKEHVDGGARLFLERARGKSWTTIGVLAATGTFTAEATNPFRVENDGGETRTNLGVLADAGGTFRLRLATLDQTELVEYSAPFDVRVMRIELGPSPERSIKRSMCTGSSSPFQSKRPPLNSSALRVMHGSPWVP